MTPDQTAQDVVDRVARAGIAAKAGRADEAQTLLSGIDKKLALWMPDELLIGIGLCHFGSGNADQAAKWLRAVRNKDGIVRLTLSESLVMLGRDAEAASVFDQGAITDAASEIDTAETLYETGEIADNYLVPSHTRRHWTEGNNALRCGDFSAALLAQNHEHAMFPHVAFGAHPLRTRSGDVPLWQGGHTRKIVFGVPDGFGDLLMFGRYWRTLRRSCDHLVLLVQEQCIDLVRANVEGVDVLPFGQMAEAFKGATAYAHAWRTAALLGYGCAQWLRCERAHDFGPGRHVGVVWRGSRTNRYDGLRSIPVEALQPLWDVPGITWHGLTLEPCPDGVVSHADELRAGGFRRTAELVAGLDCVVTVDSSVSNLCGAMGANVWTMVEADPDFRWGDAKLHGERTPWFPSARVFRQTTAGDWGDVVQRVRTALAEGLRRSRKLRQLFPEKI